MRAVSAWMFDGLAQSSMRSKHGGRFRPTTTRSDRTRSGTLKDRHPHARLVEVDVLGDGLGLVCVEEPDQLVHDRLDLVERSGRISDLSTAMIGFGQGCLL
jgi:hypothetical protein